MIDVSQSVVASYRYDPFGNTISQSGTLADANVYRFSSKEVHTNSTMYYYGYRFYDPNLQRWLNRDPINENGGRNLFEFCGNDPVDHQDSYGHKFTFPSWFSQTANIAWCINDARKQLKKDLEKADKEIGDCVEACGTDQDCIANCTKTYNLSAAIAATKYVASALSCITPCGVNYSDHSPTDPWPCDGKKCVK
jgi:RHS repeat-associated protein